MLVTAHAVGPGKRDARRVLLWRAINEVRFGAGDLLAAVIRKPDQHRPAHVGQLAGTPAQALRPKVFRLLVRARDIPIADDRLPGLPAVGRIVDRVLHVGTGRVARQNVSRGIKVRCRLAAGRAKLEGHGRRIELAGDDVAGRVRPVRPRGDDRLARRLKLHFAVAAGQAWQNRGIRLANRRDGETGSCEVFRAGREPQPVLLMAFGVVGQVEGGV
jgi:hypothetical protein